MANMKLLAAAAVVSSLIATPSFAKDMKRQSQVTQEYNSTNVGYRDDYLSRDDGFWPGEVAAGVVSGAVGTAGAIASAPFQPSTQAWGPWGNTYESSAPPRDSYAQRMGFVCQPGTWFRGEDGRQHICQ